MEKRLNIVQAHTKEKFMAAVQTEEDVLSCLLNNPRSIQKVAELLKPEHFWRDVNATVYKVMLHLYHQDRKCNIFNVEDELERQGKMAEIVEAAGYGFLTTLMAREVAFNVEDPARVVIRKAKMRNLKYAIAEIAQLAEDEDEDAVEKSLKLISDVALDTDSGNVTSFADAVDEYMADLWQRREDYENGIAHGLPTGFPDLDKLLGGLQPSRLYTLGALTGYGKSALAINVALNIALKAKHVMMISLEMPKSEIIQRALSIYAEKDQTTLRDANLDQNAYDTLRIHANRLRQCKIDLDDASYSINAMVSNIKRVHAHEKLDLIVVDYLQLVENTEKSRNSNRAQEVAEISKQLKRLAMKLEVPVLALVQLNREVERQQEQEPKLADINESGGIARDSDVVMFIWSMKDQMERRERAQMYQVIVKVAKNRNGRMGNATLLFAPRITKFRDLDVQNMEPDNE